MIPNDIQSEKIQQLNWYQVFTDVSAIIGVSFGIIFILIDTKFAQTRIERAFGVTTFLMLDTIPMLISIVGLGFACWKGIKILLFFRKIKISNTDEP